MLNKRQSKPNGKSRIENPETLSTFGTQDSGMKTNKAQKHVTATVVLVYYILYKNETQTRQLYNAD